MPQYMTQFVHTPEAWSALAKKPENREEAVGALLQKMGCRLISFYYCFGDYDGLFIYEAPDDTTAAAAIVAAVSPGHIKAVRTTTLLRTEQGLEAVRMAGMQSYRAPGQ
jgi:uncharacterized protein with GYD domain